MRASTCCWKQAAAQGSAGGLWIGLQTRCLRAGGLHARHNYRWKMAELRIYQAGVRQILRAFPCNIAPRSLALSSDNIARLAATHSARLAFRVQTGLSDPQTIRLGVKASTTCATQGRSVLSVHGPPVYAVMPDSLILTFGRRASAVIWPAQVSKSPPAISGTPQ